MSNEISQIPISHDTTSSTRVTDNYFSSSKDVHEIAEGVKQDWFLQDFDMNINLIYLYEHQFYLFYQKITMIT